MHRQVQEPVAKQAFDSVKEVVDYFQRHFMNLEMQGLERPEHLAEQFERTRALRDTLADALHDRLGEFELESSLGNLLVSCCVFSIETLTDQLRQGKMDAEQQHRIREEMRGLFAISSRFASEPVTVIQRPDRSMVFPQEVRRIVEAINNGVRTGDVQDMPDPAQGPSILSNSDQMKIMSDTDFIHNEWRQDDGARAHIPVSADPLSGARPTHTPGLETGACIEFGPGTDAEFGDPDTSFVADEPFALPEKVVIGQLSINCNRLRDPNLRAIAATDYNTLNGALAARDLRISVLMLCSVLETVVLDVAISRRHEFGLQGAPDTWNLQRVLTDLLAEAGAKEDRRTIGHVLSCRNLLRPAIQLTKPVSYEQDEVVAMLGAVQRLLGGIGFSVPRTGM